MRYQLTSLNGNNPAKGEIIKIFTSLVVQHSTTKVDRNAAKISAISEIFTRVHLLAKVSNIPA